MNNDHPFTTHGDEALEARIVAWVLGEASAFEVAELERLCAERPELMVFKRRMLALHDLLREAENPQADESWKLPSEKRKAVDDISCNQQVEELQQARERRVKRSSHRALFAIAAALVLLAVLAGLLAPAGVRMRKKSDLAVAQHSELQRQLEGTEMAEESKIELSALDADKLTHSRSLGGVAGKSNDADLLADAAEMPSSSLERNSAMRSLQAPASLRSGKPSEPSAHTKSNTAAVITAGTASSVPVPELDVSTPSLDFGDDDFGDGWGNASGRVAGEQSLRSHAARDGDEYWDTSQVAAKEIASNGEREFHAGYKSEYLWKGMDLAGEKLAEELAKNAPPRAESQITPSWKFDEKMAVEEPYSTFSLNISDASFRIAQAALAKGEQPDPAGIKVEQFYNAFDYGDPAPAAGEPVSCAIEQAAHPVIPGRNLVRIALKTAATGRSAAQPLRLTLLVDQSGSMSRADRRAAMDQAFGGLAGLLTKDDLVNVIGFSRTPRLLADGMTSDQAGELADLVNQAASEGGTNLEEAIKLADQLALRHHQPGAQNRIVLFTDGAANLGDSDPARLAEKVKELRQKGIAFDIAGIAADDLNDALLGELARNGNGRYYVVGKNADENFAKQLAGAFRPAAENVKVQVRFNPERVARYKLIGFEKDRLKTEDFRNDQVDAAELSAEEAGVAIYQVEPLPDGRGEIGEVSVRFRDTNSDEMVERTWTIPHDVAAPALDRATPSIQLATLAMLAAEKLKGGPLGQAIDFKQFAAPQAEVRTYYSGNPRVSELLQMLEQLK